MKKLNKNKTFFASSIATVGLAALTMTGSAQLQQVGLRRTDLQRHDLGIAGQEVIQARVEIDPGAVPVRHKHPGVEIIYVLEGLLEYQVEGERPVTLKAGEVLFIPTGKIHSAKNVGSGNAAELATYVVEKGKPLIVLVK